MIGYMRSYKFECRSKYFKVAMMSCAQAVVLPEEECLKREEK